MLIPHGHFDHIADAVGFGQKSWPASRRNLRACAWLESKGVKNTCAMNKGGTQKVGEIEVTMVNAIHSCGIQGRRTRSFTEARRADILFGCPEALPRITRATPQFLAT